MMYVSWTLKNYARNMIHFVFLFLLMPNSWHVTWLNRFNKHSHADMLWIIIFIFVLFKTQLYIFLWMSKHKLLFFPQLLIISRYSSFSKIKSRLFRFSPLILWLWKKKFNNALLLGETRTCLSDSKISNTSEDKIGQTYIYVVDTYCIFTLAVHFWA